MATVESASIFHRGCNLAYDVRGDGPPVVLIQGVGIHGDGWLPQINTLMDQFQCLSFDNRGMGRSQPIGTKLSVEQMANDTQMMMDKLGWESAHVIGHSLGGLIALHLALSSRKRVRSLSLLCTFSQGSSVTKLSAGMMWAGLRTRIGTKRQRRNAFLEMVMPAAVLAREDKDALAERLVALFGHDLADQPPIVMKQLSATQAYDATPRLAELAGLPVLVLSAKHDRIAKPEFGKSIADSIPDARYVEFTEAAHGAPIQCPERMNALLMDHLTHAEAGVRS